MATIAVASSESLGIDELLNQARAGSREAVQLLIGHNERAMRWLIRRWLDRRCARIYDVDDVLQEIRLNFLSRAIDSGAFASRQTFGNYCLRSVVHKCLEIRRRWLKGKRRQLEQEADQLAVEPVDGHPQDWVENELWEEVVRLYFRYQDLVADIYSMAFQRTKPWQIAEKTGLSLRTVYRCLGVAERRLRTSLQR